MTNSKSTRRALFTSALAMLMCVAMLIGTTFAWFTDTASTAVNKIQSGKLDVELQMLTKDDGEETATWKNAEGKTLTFKTADNREADKILWEPGCTYELPKLRIVNKGNLALKYKVIITGIQGSAKLNDAIEWTITNDADGETTDLSTTEYHLTAKNTDNASDILTIKGHMKNDAGNEYQDKTIEGIGITVIATQDTVEYDSSNNTYDASAAYPTAVTDAAGAKTALADGGNVILADDITVTDGKDLNIVNNDTSIDFNGKTLKGALSSGSISSGDPGVNLVLSDPNNDGTTYSIDSNLVQVGLGHTQTAAVAVWKPTVTIESGRYTHDSAVILNQLQTSDAEAVGVVVNGGTFDGKEAAAVIANVIGTVIVNNGVFNATDSADDFGACVCLDYGSSYVPTITTINGGTFNAGKVLFYVFEGSSDYTQKITVNGGNFTVAEGGELIKLSSSGNAADYLVITGGTFNVDPSAYVDTANYQVTSSGSTWTVTAK